MYSQRYQNFDRISEKRAMRQQSEDKDKARERNTVPTRDPQRNLKTGVPVCKRVRISARGYRPYRLMTGIPLDLA